MSSPTVLRWAIAAPCAVGLGVAIALASWHFQDTGSLKFFRGESASAQAGSPTVVEGGGHSGATPVPASTSSMALPSLVQRGTVNHERQPTGEEFAALLEQEKHQAANEALASYILSNEEQSKLNHAASACPPAHPLVEELINKPNAMRGSVVMNSLVPGSDGSGVLNLGRNPHDVLREAAQAFNSPPFAPLRADAQAVADMTLGQVSALLDLQEEVQSRLEQGRGGALGDILGLQNGGGLNLSSGTHRALGNFVANALGGSSSGDGSGGSIPFMGNYMTPPVGTPVAPGGVAVGVDSSELAVANALVEQFRRLLPDLSEAEMQEYLRRVETEGKLAARQWLVRKIGKQ